MSDTILMIAILAIIVLIIIVYLAIKEKESARKMAMIEIGIDTLNQELFRITKELETLRKQTGESSRQDLEIDTDVIDSIVHNKLKPFAIQMQNLDEKIIFLSEDLTKSIQQMQKQLKQITFPNEHAVPPEKQILQLHSQGYDAESIAKQLRLGKGEVDLVLKFSKIHA